MNRFLATLAALLLATVVHAQEEGTRITDLDPLSVAPAAGDLWLVVDVDDPTESADGTAKIITTANLFAYTGAFGGNAATATALAANPADCSSGQYATTIAASGALTCAQVNYSELTGTVPNAPTATALAANGSNCSAGSWAAGVDASGASEGCTADDDQPDADAEVPDAITVSAGTVTNSDVTLKAGTAPTVDGRIEYDTTLEAIVLGDDGTGTKTVYPGLRAASVSDGGPATTATAAAADGTDCSAGQYARGVDTSWNATNCTTDDDVPESGDFAAGVDLEADGSVSADSVALGTDTTGNYAGSASEGGAATTATALAANGANCSAGNYPLGVDASGAVESCTAAGGVAGPGSSTDNAIPRWDGTGGATLQDSACRIEDTGAVVCTVSDAATNSVTTVESVTHSTSGAATTGFGASSEVSLEDAAGNAETAAKHDTTWVDATNGSEDSCRIYYTKTAGSYVESFRTCGAQVLVPYGTDALPGIAFTSDPNTGIDHVLDDYVHIVAGGSRYMQIGPSFKIGDTATPTTVVIQASTSHSLLNNSGFEFFGVNVGNNATPATAVATGFAGKPGQKITTAASATSYHQSFATAEGAEWQRGASSELLTLSTSGTTTDTTANLLPADAIIEAVVVRITTTITTATDWSVGDPTTATRFCNAHATLTAGTTRVCLAHQQGSIATDATGPVQSAAAKVRITTTGTPGAGAIRITVFWRKFVAPTS